jgi:hypothetical protein
MKHLKIAGLCLVSMLMMGMTLAGNASAALLWLLCLPKTGGLFTGPACSKAQDVGNGSWESESIGNRTDLAVLRGFTIKLQDTGATGGSSAIQCSGPGVVALSTGESGGKGKITKAEVEKSKTECSRLEGGCKAGEVESVKGANLPWSTEIFETEKKLLTAIASSAATEKEPGWTISCNSLLGVQTDTCTSPSRNSLEYALLENRTSFSSTGVEELLVYGDFENRSNGHCTQSGSNTGHVTGAFAILLSSNAHPLVPSGLGLSINQ